MKASDGKTYRTQAADIKGIFRIIQSIPSPKAEPFKQWMAQFAAQRLEQMQDPELDFQQAFEDYRRLGYSERWVNQRLQSIQARKELTDEWERAGVKEGLQRQRQQKSHAQKIQKVSAKVRILPIEAVPLQVRPVQRLRLRQVALLYLPRKPLTICHL